MSQHAPGFYDDGHGVQRWWNGHQWTQHVDQTAVATTGSPGLQRDVLNGEIAKFAAQGWGVQHQDGHQAVLSRRIRMSVILNLIGVVLTGGLWLIYVLVRIASPRFERRVITVDHNGVPSYR